MSSVDADLLMLRLKAELPAFHAQVVAYQTAMNFTTRELVARLQQAMEIVAAERGIEA